MSLLPSEPDTSAVDETDPRVIDVNSDDADDVLSALTSDTARQVLSELHDDPAPPAELAERVDTSLQNAQYHLEKLEDAGAIEVIDQIYSEKGREMNVYAPADQPLVILAGNEDQSSGLKAALSRFLGSLGIIAMASVAIQEVFGGGVANLFGGSGGTEDSGAAPGPAPPAGNGTGTPTSERLDGQYTGANGTEDGGGIQIASEPSTTVEKTDQAREVAAEATRTATDAATTAGSGASDAAAAALGLEPGVVFFLGGLTALAVVAAVWYVTN